MLLALLALCIFFNRRAPNGMLRPVNGFVRLQLGGGARATDTAVVAASAAPEWNEQFLLPADDLDASLRVKVMDKKLANDFCLGVLHVPLSTIPANAPAQATTHAVPMRKKSGVSGSLVLSLHHENMGLWRVRARDARRVARAPRALRCSDSWSSCQVGRRGARGARRARSRRARTVRAAARAFRARVPGTRTDRALTAQGGHRGEQRIGPAGPAGVRAARRAGNVCYARGAVPARLYSHVGILSAT